MYAAVAIARPVRDPYTYAVPPWLEVAVGHVVLVPFGRTQETGYVVAVDVPCDLDPGKIKPITRLLDPEPAFDARQLAFFEWVARYYLAPLGLVCQTALPSEIRAKTVLVLQPTDAGVDTLTTGDLPADQLLVLRETVSRPGLTRRGMLRRLSAELDAEPCERAIDALVRRDLVATVEREVKEAQGRVRTVTLAADLDERLPRAGKRMKAVVESLVLAGGTRDLAELVAEQGASARDAVDRLAAAGVVALSDREDRDVVADAPALGPSAAPRLTADQRAALDALTAPDAAGTFLLHGVTGSGKTEVFLGAAEHALSEGRQVLVLVPEIGLTPQLVGRFRARFGDQVAVLHSGLTGSDRLAQWRRIRAGDARVAVGARSALFAPFSALGLLVVDEEHDDSYKQDDGVRYNARDLAVVLGRDHGCPTVLASATPSLESWYNARMGRYTLLRLPKRATPRPVPRIELVDLTELDAEDRPLLAPDVETALRETFARGGKAVVLYNRRGYATMVQCTDCGGTYECPNCGITMTLHLRARTLACHYCGFKRPYQEECPSCGQRTLEESGKGTEQIEEVLRERFPGVAQARMDADTTAVRGSHHRILSDFRDGRVQLLVGTQIVAKGHDFPDVHVAVVVSADRGFRFPDFRAAERTHALIVQVAGRAGRGDVAGRVFVQTWDAGHYALKHLDDVDAFLEVELKLRATLRYPPFTRLVLIRVDGVDRTAAGDAARDLARDLRAAARHHPQVDVLGPAQAALPKLVGRWRFQVVVRGREIPPLRRFLERTRDRIEETAVRGVRVAVDVDPRHLA